MGKYSIKAGRSTEIGTVQESFYFNYGEATVSLNADGVYTLYANGSESSEFVNSARRDYQYKKAVQKVTDRMIEAYEEATRAFTGLYESLAPPIDSRAIEEKREGLVLMRYTEPTFVIPRPKEEDVRHELEQVAEQVFFKTFGRNTRQIEEYVNAEIKQAYAARLKAWEEVRDYHHRIQSQNAEKQNRYYLSDYSKKKEELDNILNGPEEFVDAEIRKVLDFLNLPFDIFVETHYDRTHKTLEVDIEIPQRPQIPIKKATKLSTGKISIKNKTHSEALEDLALFFAGVPYFFASKLFNVSTNIESISITLWGRSRSLGYIWIVFPRNVFISIISSNKAFSPFYYLSFWESYSCLDYCDGGLRSVDGIPKDQFLRAIDNIKNPVQAPKPATPAKHTLPKADNSVSQGSDSGDLNPDPFHLSISDAKRLAESLKSAELQNAVYSAIWEGSDTVPIDSQYLNAWKSIQ